MRFKFAIYQKYQQGDPELGIFVCYHQAIQKDFFHALGGKKKDRMIVP
jgi:hypothetical protein